MLNFKLHKHATWASIATLIYALSMFLSSYDFMIIHPPARYALIALLILVSIYVLLAIYSGKLNFQLWGLVVLAMVWSVIAWLYLIHPIPNNEFVLCIMIIGNIFCAIIGGWHD